MRATPYALLLVAVLTPLALPRAANAQSHITPPAAAGSVIVTGEVRSPGRLALAPPVVTLLDAIVQAGSQTLNAGDEVIVSRQKPGAESERFVVLRTDVDQGKIGSNLVLRSGDIVNVPTARRFYVSGFVRNPGSFVLHTGLTVQQAIVQAGGISDRGSENALQIGRMVDGKSVSVNATLADVLQPNDEIKVGRAQPE